MNFFNVCASARYARALRQEILFGADQVVHNHEILVDKMHCFKGFKM